MREYETAAPAAQPAAPVPAGSGGAITALTPSVVLAMQRTAGNRAVTGRLQRNNSGSGQVRGPAAGRPVRSDATPAQGPPAGWADLPAHVLAFAAAHHYTHQFHRDLVQHYVWGYGAPFWLTRDRMHQVIAPPSAKLNIVGDRQRWPQVDQLEATLADRIAAGGPGVLTAQIRTSATVSCDDHLPSLGSFTAHIEGTLTASRGHLLSPADQQAIETRAADAELRNQLFARLGSPRRVRVEEFDAGAVYFSFAGTMHWYDRWDFDPHVPAAAGAPGSFPQQRTPDAEEGVRLSHDYLPGQAFDVRSEIVPVTQRPGTSGAMF